jgi:hypothetical protein
MYMQLLNYGALRTFYALSVRAHDGMPVRNGARNNCIQKPREHGTVDLVKATR